MKDFGTFDTLTNEEDTIYSRLAVIRRELDRLDLEQNEAQQDIKMWRNKMSDEMFKVKFWLVAALVMAEGARIRPMEMMMGPVTMGGKKRMTFFTPKRWISRATTT